MVAKRITYRELRNTPGKVFERLSAGEPLALVSDGEAKAILIPVDDGEVATALESWKRGRALVALARLQAGSRERGVASTPLGEINAEIKRVRKARRALEKER